MIRPKIESSPYNNLDHPYNMTCSSLVAFVLLLVTWWVTPLWSTSLPASAGGGSRCFRFSRRRSLPFPFWNDRCCRNDFKAHAMLVSPIWSRLKTLL